jgi:PleD family two-component response regulator
VKVRASIGVAAWMPGLTAAGVIRLADQAMYEEKLKANRQPIAS